MEIAAVEISDLWHLATECSFCEPDYNNSFETTGRILKQSTPIDSSRRGECAHAPKSYYSMSNRMRIQKSSATYIYICGGGRRISRDKKYTHQQNLDMSR